MKTTIAILVIFAFGLFLNFYNLITHPIYSAEISQHFLDIIRLNHGQLLIEGPLTSHSWFRLSAAPYYVFYPLFALLQFHPLSLHLLWVVLSSLGTLLSYLTVSLIYNKRAGLVAALFSVISPNLLLLNQLSGFYLLIIPLSYVLWWQSNEVFFKKSSRVWLLFFIVGWMCALHASAFLLVPFYLVALLFFRVSSIKNLLQSALAFSITQLPLLLNEASHHFSGLVNFTLWIPYKVYSFLVGQTLGVSNASVNDESLQIIAHWFITSFFPPSVPWFYGIFLLIFLGLFLTVVITKRHINITVFFTVLLMYGTAVLWIHKNPPVHYFVPLVTIPVVILSGIITTSSSKLLNVYSSLLLVFLVSANINFIFSNHYLFRKWRQLDTYQSQLEVSKLIISDAGNSNYSLLRRGDFDNYANDFADNYVYLLWWLGNRPIENAETEYVIVEDEMKTSPDLVDEVGRVGEVVIYKKSD